jgi:hypothetical protein
VPDIITRAEAAAGGLTRRLPAVLGVAALMLAPAAHATDVRLRCEMKGGNVILFAITGKTAQLEQHWSSDTQTLPVEETPTQFRFPTVLDAITINRITGEIFLSNDLPVSGTCALAPAAKF